MSTPADQVPESAFLSSTPDQIQLEVEAFRLAGHARATLQFRPFQRGAGLLLVIHVRLLRSARN